MGRGAVGVGLLIVLIALVLVAAIVGFVLITNENALQEDSLNTATAARKEVTTQVELVELSATDGRDGELDNFRYSVRLKPGAEPIKLSDVVLYVNTYNQTLRLIYKEGACRRDVTDGYFTYR